MIPLDYLHLDAGHIISGDCNGAFECHATRLILSAEPGRITVFHREYFLWEVPGEHKSDSEKKISGSHKYFGHEDFEIELTPEQYDKVIRYLNREKTVFLPREKLWTNIPLSRQGEFYSITGLLYLVAHTIYDRILKRNLSFEQPWMNYFEWPRSILADKDSLRSRKFSWSYIYPWEE